MTDPLLVPLSVLALDLDNTATELAAALAHVTLTDDLGRVAVDRATARRVIAEHRAAQAAAAAAERERAEAERVERGRRAAADRAEQVARQVRADRQRQLLAENPTLDPLTLMKLTDDDDRRMDVAGRSFDGYIAAQRRGEFGFGQRFAIPTNEE